MLDRMVVKDFLQEEMKGIDIPSNMSIEDIVESFCQFVENDYYEWLKDNYKAFFNYGDPDWEWIKEKINKIEANSCND